MNIVVLGALMVLLGRTQKAIPLFEPGEPIVFEVSVSNDVPSLVENASFVWERTGDDGVKEHGTASPKQTFRYKTSLDRPGFVRFYGEVRDAGNKVLAKCDLGAGVDISKIKIAVPAPADMKDFWERRKAAFSKVEWRDKVQLKEIKSANSKVTLYEFALPCWGGKPATGYLAVPCKAGKYGAKAKFFGYNESWTYKRALLPPTTIEENFVQMWVNPHGVEMGHDEKYYQEMRELTRSNGYTHGFDPAQNADPEKTYWAGVSARILRALEYLKSRSEWDGKCLIVHGGSQGGMQSVWCAALDGAVTECNIHIPWNCDIGGETIGRNRGNWYVKWVPALGYYDTANLGALIPSTCRVNVAMAGLGDYICPPTGVMAFYNALQCPKRIAWFQNSQHGNRLEPKPQLFTISNDKIEKIR